MGNSSGDENGSNSMKYWEIIADNLSWLARRGDIVAPLPETAGVELLTLIATMGAATSSILTNC